jgi:hypothetical protein
LYIHNTRLFTVLEQASGTPISRGDGGNSHTSDVLSANLHLRITEELPFTQARSLNPQLMPLSGSLIAPVLAINSRITRAMTETARDKRVIALKYRKIKNNFLIERCEKH